jgi:photosystem II stability/assembly factor-like uncharacterized protein
MLKLFLLTLLLSSIPSALVAQAWERLGPPGGTVISLAAAPDGTVYLGTPDGHVFASINRGKHWNLRGRAGGRLDGVVQQIVPDAAHNNRLLAAVWFRNSPGGGVFESLDGAQHWRLAGLREETVRTLEQSLSEPSVWLAGTRTGVFRSIDDARSWQRITPANDPELQNVDSLAVDPRDSQTIYVGTYHLPWKTADGGKSWNPIAAGMIDDSDIMSLRIDAQNPQRIFSSACSGIYRSEDAGASWTKLQGIPYSSRRTQQIVQDAANPSRLYAATTEGLWMTGDYGETWKRVTPRETNAYAVAVLPADSGERVLVGVAAQGVLRSEDAGNSFASWNEGFSHRVLFALASDPGDASHLLARLEGFAGTLLETRDGGRSWVELSERGRSKTVAQIFGSSSGWWASFAEGGLARFDVATMNWRENRFQEVLPPATRARVGALPGSPPRFRTLSLHATSLFETGRDTVVSTEDGLWRKKPDGDEFRAIPSKGLPRSVTLLSVAARNAWLAIAEKALWTSDERGLAWERIATPSEGGAVLWVQERAGKGTAVRWLGTERGVYISESGAEWRLLSNGLPPIASEPPAFNDSTALISMSNGGFYESSDGGVSWRRVEGDSEQGRAGILIPERSGDFWVGSYSEGLLRFANREH